MFLGIINYHTDIPGVASNTLAAGSELDTGSFFYQLPLDDPDIPRTSAIGFTVNIYVITWQILHAVTYRRAIVAVVQTIIDGFGFWHSL
jgi:hypothetical protein